MKSIFLTRLLTLAISLSVAFGLSRAASAGDHGRGTLGKDLLSFKTITDPRLEKINFEIIEKVQRIDFSNVPELKNLAAELMTPVLEMTTDAYKNPNQYPGDWREGGLLYGYTDLIPGAPTLIYPVALLPNDPRALNDGQLRQLLVHEALHRTLPNPLNGLENLVVTLTRIVLLYAEDRVISAAQTVLARYQNLEPRFSINVGKPVGAPKEGAATPRLDSVNAKDGLTPSDFSSLIDGLSLKVKNRIHLDFDSESKTVSRFTIALDSSKVDLAPYIFAPQNWESLTANGNANYKKWFIDGSVFYLIASGTLNIRITDSFNPNRNQYIRIDLSDLQPNPKLLQEKKRNFNISELDFYGGYKNKGYTSLRTESYGIYTIEQLRGAKTIQANALKRKVYEEIRKFFEAVEFDQPLY
jgi:hypothetical protein